jgi:hypothetical protein
MRLKQSGAYGIEALKMVLCKESDDPPKKGAEAYEHLPNDLVVGWTRARRSEHDLGGLLETEMSHSVPRATLHPGRACLTANFPSKQLTAIVPAGLDLFGLYLGTMPGY